MDEAGRIGVVIVDDHQVVRQGLRTFLELHDDLVVLGEAADGVAAVDLVRRVEPDVVLMDLVMPTLDGIGATAEICGLGLATKVIALTSFAEDDRVFPAIQAGASSYLLKDVSPADLVDAIRAVHRGEPRLHPDVARKLMQATRVGPGGESHGERGRDPLAAVDDLTEREREVIRLVAKGLSNQEIARAFVISEKTVKTHMSNILGKLGLKDRTQLAIFALKHELADPDDAT